MQVSRLISKCGVQQPGCAVDVGNERVEEGVLTLNTNVYVILRLLGLSCIFVGFGEGVYMTRNVSYCTLE